MHHGRFQKPPPLNLDAVEGKPSILQPPSFALEDEFRSTMHPRPFGNKSFSFYLIPRCWLSNPSAMLVYGNYWKLSASSFPRGDLSKIKQILRDNTSLSLLFGREDYEIKPVAQYFDPGNSNLSPESHLIMSLVQIKPPAYHFDPDKSTPLDGSLSLRGKWTLPAG